MTGSLFSGSSFYLKNYSNISSGSAVSGGFYATIFDGSPTSLSSSALVDMTYGISSQSLEASSPITFVPNEKQRIYKQFARYLLGSENNLFTFNGKTANEMFFFSFKRRIYKDEIAKGTVSFTIQRDGDTLIMSDAGAAGAFSVGQGGDSAPLYSGSVPVGAVYYNAGVVAFQTGAFFNIPGTMIWSGSKTLNQMSSSNIDQMVDGLRSRVTSVQFQNQTNLHSTVYFLRALNSEFNYSTNPSFTDASGRIVPTSGTDNQTRTYITTCGLYDINDNLLAVAKLSQPVKKSPDSELVIRCKLSY